MRFDIARGLENRARPGRAEAPNNSSWNPRRSGVLGFEGTFPLARPLRGFLHWSRAVCRCSRRFHPAGVSPSGEPDGFHTMATPKNKNSSGRRGLLAGGNWIIDQVKLIDVYPQREQLANILSQSQGTGGAPYNVLIDLARLGANFPLLGAGLVGSIGNLLFYHLQNVGQNAATVVPFTSLYPLVTVVLAMVLL